MRRYFISLLLVLLAAAPYACGQNRIVVSKPNLRLHVIGSDGDTLFTAPVACGLRFGNKQKSGDMKTPEGSFTVCSIEPSHYWVHDFGDGVGQRQGAYGPWFFRLSVPHFSSIGIHGTCFPETVGMRASEGCVRLKNADLLELRQYIVVGMPCTIEPDLLQDGTPQRPHPSQACWVGDDPLMYPNRTPQFTLRGR